MQAQISFFKDGVNQSVCNENYDYETNTITFSPYKDSLNTFAVWFNFGVTGYRTDTLLTFESSFANRFHNPNYPVYSSDSCYNFQSVKNLGTGNRLRVEIMPENDTIYFATGYPYHGVHWENFISNYFDSKYLTFDTLSYLQILTITNRKKSDKNKNLIWITCRQHAFESPSNYVLEGMLKTLLDEKCKKKIYNKFIFKIVPFIDIRNVVCGQTGRMGLPKDFNRDWFNPVHQQILSLENLIESTSKKSKYYMYWDIHGTYPGGDNKSIFSYFDIYNHREQSDRMANYWYDFFQLTKYHPIAIMDNQKNYNGLTADMWNALNFHQLQFAMTLEIDWSINPRGEVYKLDDYYEIGEYMIKALEIYKTAK